MIRSLTVSLIHAHNFISCESASLLQHVLPVSVPSRRLLHLSSSCWSSDFRRRPGKREEDRRLPSKGNSEFQTELEEAAIDAARSLPGDWNLTSEDLLAKLQTFSSRNVKEPQSQKEQKPTTSPLETVAVGRTNKKKFLKGSMVDSVNRHAQRVRDEELYSMRTPYPERVNQGPKMVVGGARPSKDYKDMFNEEPRMNIFDAEKIKQESQTEASTPPQPDDLWAQVDAEKTWRAMGGIPRNGFEEMIQWTKEGRLWKFPIDNESYMIEEKKYTFKDHVFLERHLAAFPQKGPIRKFMSLVCLGLSLNPSMTVPEKLEHIQWFARYFQQHQDVAVSALGEDGRMKNTDQ